MVKVFKNKPSDIISRDEINKRHTIMFVDDTLETLTSLTELFSKEYEIIASRNGKEALEHIQKMERKEKISLIICDQRTPGLTGIELLMRLKKIIPKTIRVIYTAYCDVPLLLDAINEAKVYEFIEKDIDPGVLKLRINRAVEEYEKQRKLDEYNESMEQMVKELTKKN
jgi:response regulator RpfG family c-di-GMP phosphodiesterase